LKGLMIASIFFILIAQVSAGPDCTNQ